MEKATLKWELRQGLSISPTKVTITLLDKMAGVAELALCAVVCH